MKLIPTKDQEKALDALRKFLKGDNKEFILSGKAGTGKTTIIKELFVNKNNMIPSNVLGVTIAHKARINLSNSIPNSTTAAAALAMKIQYDEHGKIFFVASNKKNDFAPISCHKYIVFDEASMISIKLRNIILEKINKNAKVIWIGDFRQLPPIEENKDGDSPVFDIKDRYELTEKVRQTEGDHIATLADFIAERIDTDCDLKWISYLTSKFNVEDKKGYAITTQIGAMNSFIKNFKEKKNVRLTAYRNKRINELNNIVRSELFPDNKELYVKGELLIANNQYTVDDDIIFYNGEDLWVRNVDKIKFLDLQCFSLDIGKDEPAIVVAPESYEAHNKELNRLKAIALKNNKLWNMYYRYYDKFANVSYGYAVNNYKIQGTTVYGIYMDIQDPLSIKVLTDKEKLQAIYVSTTRATHNVAIF
jgi:exodeoxyribonuclease-5